LHVGGVELQSCGSIVVIIIVPGVPGVPGVPLFRSVCIVRIVRVIIAVLVSTIGLNHFLVDVKKTAVNGPNLSWEDLDTTSCIYVGSVRGRNGGQPG
jgi:hypothetical protein